MRAHREFVLAPFLVVVLHLLSSCASRPLPPIVTSDVDRFLGVLQSNGGAPSADTLRRDYLERGSPGLQEFLRMRIESPEALAKAVANRRQYYGSLASSLASVSSVRPEVGKALRRLERLYPDAKLPPVYIVIGRMNSAGISTDTGLVIGAEMFGAGAGVPVEELSKWQRSVIKPVSELPGIVAHELIHFQQRPRTNETLLAQAIREGSADFVGELISGRNSNHQLRAYGDAHAAELWREFSTAMTGTDLSRWLYQGDKSTDRPADLGYWIGYEITSAYYANAPDKRQALREILTVTDYEEFLRRSRYAERFRE